MDVDTCIKIVLVCSIKFHVATRSHSHNLFGSNNNISDYQEYYNQYYFYFYLFIFLTAYQPNSDDMSPSQVCTWRLRLFFCSSVLLLSFTPSSGERKWDTVQYVLAIAAKNVIMHFQTWHNVDYSSNT